MAKSILDNGTLITRVKIVHAKSDVVRSGEYVKRLKLMDEYPAEPVLRVLGVPFGGPVMGRDAEGEAFYPETDIWLKTGDSVPVTYYHGFGPDDPYDFQQVPAVIGRAMMAESDERGHWFEVRLDPDEELAQRILTRDPSEIRASSGAVGHLVRMGDAGLIDVWPVGELALFDVNEWRLPANDFAVVEAGKSLAEAVTQAGEAEVAAAKDGAELIKTSLKTMEVFEMEKNENENVTIQAQPLDYKALAEALAPSIKEAVAAQVQALYNESPTVKGGIVAPGVMKHANLGDPDPVQDFLTWVHTGKGQIKKHTVLHDFGKYKAALQEGTDGEGGYLVPADELGRIIAKRGETGLIDKLGCTTFNTDRDVFNIPTEGTAMTKFSIVAEEAAITAAENEPTFGQNDVKLYNFKKLIKISEELFEDYNSGLEVFLSDAIGRAWAATENYYIQIGGGSTAPQGVFVGGTAGLTLDSASAIGAGEVPELLGKLKIAYRPGAVVLMNRTTAAYLRQLFSTSGFSFPVSASIITAGGEDLNIGYPVFPTEDAAAIGASAKSMLFGNFTLYGWVRNRSLRVRRLVELYAGNGQIGLLASFRAGGEVLQAEAFQYATHPSA